MLFLLSILSFSLTGDIPPTSPKKTNLNVNVQNIRTHTGMIHVGLYRACPNFPNCQPVELKLVDAKENSIQTAFMIEPGDYAVAVYHDQNNNGHMDKRVFGIPKEPYGFSNNFRPVMSAPKFKDCKFSVDIDGKVISINLN